MNRVSKGPALSQTTLLNGCKPETSDSVLMIHVLHQGRPYYTYIHRKTAHNHGNVTGLVMEEWGSYA